MRRIQKWALVWGAVLAFGGVCRGQVTNFAGANANAAPVLALAGTVYDTNGAPAPGVVLLVAGSAGTARADIKSDANGKYALTWRPPQTSAAAPRARAYALVGRDLEHNLAAMRTIDEMTTNLDLHLQPGLAILTTLQDSAGKPVSNGTTSVMIYVAASGAAPVVPPITADDQGRVEIPALPQGGRYILTFKAPGYGSVSQITILEYESRTNRLILPAVEFPLPNLKLAGQVLWADGQPAIGARVTISGVGQLATNTTSDATGHFSLSACEGPVVVTASGGRGNPRQVRATGGDTNVVVRLPSAKPAAVVNTPNDGDLSLDGPLSDFFVKPVTVIGTVFDPSGKPAPGVAIELLGPRSSVARSVKSDASGKFTFVWQPANLSVGTEPGAALNNLPENFLVSRDEARNLAVTARIDKGTTILDLRLQPGLTLSGVVRDNTGAPVKNCTVWLHITGGGSSLGIGERPAALSEQGTFTIGALPQDGAYRLNVSAPGFGAAAVTVPATDTHAASLQLPPISLKPADRPLEGIVLGPDGTVVPGATVQVSGTGQPFVSTLADGKGHFALKVCEGVVSLMATLLNNANGPRISATGTAMAYAGDTNVVLKLSLPASRPAAAPARIQPAPTNVPPPLGPFL